MKILIIRNIPTYMRVVNNTYNIQEVGLAKALVRRGHVCDILFWTDQEVETLSLPVEAPSSPAFQIQPADVSGGVGTSETSGDETSGEHLPDVQAGGVHSPDMSGGVVRVFYRHGRSFLKNTVFSGCRALFAQYDILQPCEYNQLQSWLLAGSDPERTIIYHGPYDSPFNRRYNMMCRAFDALFLKRYLRRGTRFLAKSGPAARFLMEKGIAEENIAVAGVGIDTQMLSYRQMPPYNRHDRDSSGQNPLPEEVFATCRFLDACEGPRLLYIGRFEKRRNLPFVIDVFAGVLARFPSARMVLIGTGAEEEVREVFACMEKRGVREKILRLERLEQRHLSEIYRRADYFILPSHYEIFGMVLAEAMYCGNVVLTTPNGGSDMLIRDGENGFILRAEGGADTAAWVQCIEDCEADPAGTARLRASAVRTVSEHFTWDELAGRFLSQYEALLEERGFK